jgi:L-asparaginase
VTNARVLVLTLGGTISMTTEPGTGAVPSLGAAALLSATSTSAAVDTLDVRTVPGAHLTYDDLVTVHRHIVDAARSGYGGVVVVQGTDTLEETAYALDLLDDDGPTTVVTGAMRHASALGADGPANLSDAIAVAADPACRGCGVLVVLGGVVHAASLVQKTNTALPDAFTSWPGALGVVHEGRAKLSLALMSRQTIGTVPSAPEWPRVCIATAVLGATSAELLQFATRPPDALVVAGLGGGHVPESWVAPLQRLASHRPVVLSSRTGSGHILQGTYGFPGSERDLLGRGLLAAGSLGPVKAAVALTLLLAAGQDAASFFSAT